MSLVIAFVLSELSLSLHGEVLCCFLIFVVGKYLGPESLPIAGQEVVGLSASPSGQYVALCYNWVWWLAWYCDDNGGQAGNSLQTRTFI